jgi:hypothetical protein
MSESNFDKLTNKWQPVLDHEDLDPIKDPYRRAVTAQLLENQEVAMREDAAFGQYGLLGEATHSNLSGMGGTAGTNAGGTNIAGFDPVLISLVRRNAPNLIAYDICGVQPMNSPTGLIFALRSKYVPTPGTIGGQGGPTNEALHLEANSSFSGGPSQGGAQQGDTLADAISEATGFVGSQSTLGVFNAGNAVSTLVGEGFGNAIGDEFPEMGFTIEKKAVEARTRALKAEYTTELAQDLKAVHGLDAEAELANILSTEINVEINREIVRKIGIAASLGSGANSTSTAVVDLGQEGHRTALGDARWLVERFKLLAWYIEKEANRVAGTTRRGKGNLMIVSPDIASALSTSGVLDPTAALNSDVTGSTFAGTVANGIKVYIDPYHSFTNDTGQVSPSDFVIVGYKGTSAYDAGLFYCPYVPLQMVRAVGENTFQPKIGFKTRYGFTANPFASDPATAASATNGLVNNNPYYRKSLVRLG